MSDSAMTSTMDVSNKRVYYCNHDGIYRYKKKTIFIKKDDPDSCNKKNMNYYDTLMNSSISTNVST
jgi:hypothetical protein